MDTMITEKLLDAVGECRRTISRTIAEIGGLAEVLTGDRTHFHLQAPAAASQPSE
jgi:hypothetical protein